MIMTIGDKEFIQVNIDLMGKQTWQERQAHQEDVAAILEHEYFFEAMGEPVSFYCTGHSRMVYLQITDFDMKEFDIKLKAIRFLKEKDKLCTTISQ